MPVRAVVQVGRSVVRVAREGPDGEPRVVEVPVEPGVALPVLLRGLAGAADVVFLRAEAVAAGRPEVVVVDAGARATEVSLVRGGRVVTRRGAPGGDRMDAVVAGLLGDGDQPRARRVREALSLHEEAEGLRAAEVRAALRPCRAEVVRAVVAVAGRPDVPVLLVGGGARSPDLAADLDAAGLRDVVVAPRPEAAAALAALTRLPPPVSGASSRPRWLPDPPPRRRRTGRTFLAALAAAVVLGALHVLGGLLASAPGPPPTGVLAQYGYRFALPEGWAHTGGLPERRRSLLTPVAAPEGSDLIAVEATPLGYDAAAEPARAAAELRAEFDAGGPGLSGYDARARFGGRAVTAYRERAGASVVDWYVLLDGGTQLSVGCRHTPTGTAAVAAACALVVGTLRGG
ncbi:type VII secretion-associated protein [Pseudonocardia sp. KRD-176]|nr:type VII secretion-associated protein [Pseudonocardia oceani]